MNIKNIKNGRVCVLEGHEYGFFGWPSIGRLSTGELNVVSSGLRRGHVGPWGKTVMFKSTDNGETWSYPEIINDTTADDRDAGICVLPDDSTIVTWFASHPSLHMHSYENDKRELFRKEVLTYISEMASPEQMSSSLGAFTKKRTSDGVWHEKSRCPVNTPHGPILLKDGSVFYFGKFWPGADARSGEIKAFKSTDAGETWQEVGTVPTRENDSHSKYHEPHVVELSDGRFLGVIRKEPEFIMLKTFSNDGGKTWSVPEDLGVSGSPPHLIKHSSGTIILVYGHRSVPYGQRVLLSNDDGKTFEGPFELEPYCHEGDLGYPASVELDDGSIYTVFYQSPEEGVIQGILYSKWELK